MIALPLLWTIASGGSEGDVPPRGVPAAGHRKVCAPVVSERPFRSFPNTDSGVSEHPFEHPELEARSAGVR
jgi:hypothetical protein